METAQHIFTLPTGYESILLTVTIYFKNEMLHKLTLQPFEKVDLPLGAMCVETNTEQKRLLAQRDNRQDNVQENAQNYARSKQQAPMQINTNESSNILPTFARAVFLEIAEYLMGRRKEFTIPMHAEGTAFQQSVWKELLKIPYGETCSYKDIATRIQNEKACRAVGLANNRNPINLLIPCHRVIGANGALMGYAGQVPVKAALITLEKQMKCIV